MSKSFSIPAVFLSVDSVSVKDNTGTAVATPPYTASTGGIRWAVALPAGYTFSIVVTTPTVGPAPVAAPAAVDLSPVLAAIAASAGGALPGETKLFTGTLPAGYTKVSGAPPSYGAALWAYMTGNIAAGPSTETDSGSSAILAPDGLVYDLAWARGDTIKFSQLDPITMVWTLKSPPPEAQVNITPFAICALPNGKILKVGSYNNGMNNNCFVYSPAANAWSQVLTKPGQLGANASGNLHPVLVSLGDGKVFVHDGAYGAPGGCYLYDSVANTWTTLAVSPIPDRTMGLISGALLPSGDVLIVCVNGTTYKWRRSTLTWTTSSPNVPGAAGYSSFRCIPCAGGAYVLFVNKKVTYLEASDTWTGSETLPITFQPSAMIGAAALPDGSLIVGMNSTFVRYMGNYVSKTPYYASKG